MRGQQRGRTDPADGQRGRVDQARSAGRDQHVGADQRRGPRPVFGQRKPAAVHRVQVSATGFLAVFSFSFIRRLWRKITPPTTRTPLPVFRRYDTAFC